MLICQFAFCLGYYIVNDNNKRIQEKIITLFKSMKLEVVILVGIILVSLKWKIHGRYFLDTLLVPIYICGYIDNRW